jgi:NADH-quinone oxidoreductase subunit N
MDIYQGSPTPVTAFFATVPAFSLLYIFLRLIDLFNNFNSLFFYMILIIGIFSLIFGSLGAVSQRAIKRLMAYSSVVHVGYFLIFLALYLKQAFIHYNFYLFI